MRLCAWVSICIPKWNNNCQPVCRKFVLKGYFLAGMALHPEPDVVQPFVHMIPQNAPQVHAPGIAYNRDQPRANPERCAPALLAPSTLVVQHPSVHVRLLRFLYSWFGHRVHSYKPPPKSDTDMHPTASVVREEQRLVHPDPLHCYLRAVDHLLNGLMEDLAPQSAASEHALEGAGLFSSMSPAIVTNCTIRYSVLCSGTVIVSNSWHATCYWLS
jgi:hypothetical protein